MYAGTQISNISNILDKYRIFQNINVEDFHLFCYISIKTCMCTYALQKQFNYSVYESKKFSAKLYTFLHWLHPVSNLIQTTHVSGLAEWKGEN